MEWRNEFAKDNNWFANPAQEHDLDDQLRFFGVQTAFTLQSSQMSRIFQTIGADPNNLGWFFLLPPLAGLIVQPIIGTYSTGPGRLNWGPAPALPLIGDDCRRDRDDPLA